MRHVIIGAGAAGLKAAGLLRELDPSSEITVVSRDQEVYSRCMLHLNVAEQRSMDQLSFVEPDFFSRNLLTWRAGEKVEEILADHSSIRLESGEILPYDRLLIASGASSVIPPIPNLRGARNVTPLRDIVDARRLSVWGRPKERAVIIGAGLVGMDAAVALLERKVKVTLVEMMDRVLALQLDDYAASRYAALLEDHGASVIVGAKVLEAVSDGEGGVRALELAGGRRLPCDFCVVAAGVKPNLDFLKDGQILLTGNQRALAVDRHCRTSVPEIYAAGDVTCLAPIWPEAVRQAGVAAANMAGGDARLPDRDWAWTNSMNFFGLPTVSYGQTSFDGPPFTQKIYLDGEVYKKVILKNGTIRGALFQGDIDNCGLYLRLVRDRIPVGGTGKHPLKLNYADFFGQAANGEFI